MTSKLIALLALGASVATVTAASAQDHGVPRSYGYPAYRVACPHDFLSEFFGFRRSCSVPTAPGYTYNRPVEEPRAFVTISGLNGI